MNRLFRRLIYLSKNEIGRISKHILDQINTKFVSKLNLNEWKKLDECNQVVQEYNFFLLDIKNFYSSVKKMLLHEAIQFAKEHVLITRKDIEVTSQAPKSVLYNGGGIWVKKEVGSFDVIIGNIKTDGAVV